MAICSYPSLLFWLNLVFYQHKLIHLLKCQSLMVSYEWEKSVLNYKKLLTSKITAEWSTKFHCFCHLNSVSHDDDFKDAKSFHLQVSSCFPQRKYKLPSSGELFDSFIDVFLHSLPLPTVLRGHYRKTVICAFYNHFLQFSQGWLAERDVHVDFILWWIPQVLH